MKRRIIIASVCILLACLSLGLFASAETAAVANDPSVDYVKQTAPYEDESIDLWFEHSFKKVMTSDTTPSGMDTYSVYMAKNEIENAQFILYSDETKSGLSASVTDFTDANGNTIDATLRYQVYVTLDDLATTQYHGATTSEESFIREGEQPEVLMSMVEIKRSFQLNAGKSQGFYIRAKTTSDTPSGWYSAQLDIKNSSGQVIKTATVYTYVWDFEIAEKTELQTSFYMGNYNGSAVYKTAYDYLLENRLMAMDIPGNFNSDNEYLTNERVSAIRVSPGVYNDLGNSYLNNVGAFSSYKALYDDVSNMPEWEAIKDKFYFYTVDEAMSAEQQDAIGKGGATVDDVKTRSAALNEYWPNAEVVLPYHENHPYPYYHYTQAIENYSENEIKDGLQEMLETDTVSIMCPQIYAFTPLEILEENGYHGYYNTTALKSISGSISGYLYDKNARYFNWEKLYGEFADRVISANILQNEADSTGNNQLWTYSAGWNKAYTYCNHLIESSGIQTKLLFWQLYQMDITGYLYYGTTNWNEYDGENGGFIDTTTTGSLSVQIKNNKHVYEPGTASQHSIYGNGVLFYRGDMVNLAATRVAGTIRVEMLRDGVEEYQMLTMLEDLRGSEAADAVVNSVSDNVVCYLSLPGFDRSAFDGDMDDYDVLAAVRISLGNQVEEASKDVCDHDYDDGKVTLEPTCKVMGVKTYTCADCGATITENVPTLHAQGDCFVVTGGTDATCAAAGKLTYECTICGLGKYVDIPAHHENDEMIEYKPANANVHSVSCTVCGEEFERESHSFFTVNSNTCTEAGTVDQVCYDCGYTVAGEETAEAKGHCYVDGVCATCGESETPEVVVVKGNVDGDADGQVSIADLFAMKAYLIGSSELDAVEFEAADLDSDGDVDITDFYGLKKYLISGEW